MSANVKLATYNMRNSIREKAILKNLLEMEAGGVSIFCLQEMRRFEGKKFIGDTLKETFGKNWKMKYFLKPNSRDLGLCVMWKPSVFGLVSLERVYLPKIKKLHAGVKALEKIFFNRPLPTQRGAIIADFKITGSGKILRVANVHLDWLGGGHKVNQLNHLVFCLKNKPKADMEIICGDFNTVGPWGIFKKRSKEISAALGKDFKNILSGHRRTTRTYQNLDYIFANGLKAICAKRLKRRGSDHWPLIANFKV